MLYRYKFLLELLNRFPGGLGSTRLHKMMFICIEELNASAVYDFVPYKYGGFSFVLRQDLDTLQRQGWVSYEEKTTGWMLAKAPLSFELKREDRQAIEELADRYGAYSRSDLIRHTYIRSPYHAIRSEVAESYLSKEDLERVHAARPAASPLTIPILFTIGYEGISLDTYLNKLLQHSIALLCDVRKNAFSMKWGFSLRQLKLACEDVGIEYIHLPDLGINADQRQHLETQADRDELFMRYTQDTLPARAVVLNTLIQHLQTKQRIAITCFERDVCQCHRGALADTLAKRVTLKVIHL